MAESLAISQEGILGELKKIGFAEVETGPVKPTDKMKALEMMIKVLGFDMPKDGSLEQLDKVLEQIKT